MNYSNLSDNLHFEKKRIYPDFKIFTKTKNNIKERLIIKDRKNSMFLEDMELKKVSDFYEIDFEYLKNIYLENTGDLNKVISYIEKNCPIDHWSQIEDIIILTDNFEQIEELTNKRGISEVMKRRIFLKKMMNK